MQHGKLFCLVFLLTHAFAEAQNLSLSDLNIVSSGILVENSNTPSVTTQGTVAGRFVPAPWIHLNAGVFFILPDTIRFLKTESASLTPGYLLFSGASAEFPRVFDTGTNLAVFTGMYDDPASPSLLRKLLKVNLSASEFHNQPAGNAFMPVTAISGTGMAITWLTGTKGQASGIYGYWNERTDSQAAMTFDFRRAWVSAIATANAFTGYSYRYLDGQIKIRGGVTALFGDSETNQLYTEFGIRESIPKASVLERNLYFLFEPRLHPGFADIAFSFFSSPLFLETDVGASMPDANILGVNALIAFGSLHAHGMRGGISVLGSVNPLSPGIKTPYSFSVSPFYHISISDCLLEITAVIKPMHLDTLANAGELRVSLKAVY